MVLLPRGGMALRRFRFFRCVDLQGRLRRVATKAKGAAADQWKTRIRHELR
jgi:hypothetical protein